MKKTLLLLFILFSINSILRAQWVQTNGPIGQSINCLVSNGTVIYAGTDYGAYQSADSGASWTAFNNGLNGASVSSLLLKGNSIFAIANGRVFRSVNFATWTLTSNGLPSAPPFSSMYSLAAIGNSIYVGAYHGVYKSINDGASWSNFSAGYPSTSTATSLAIIDSTLIASTSNNLGVYLCDLHGTTWIPSSSAVPVNYNCGLFIIDTVAYASTSIGLYRSYNRGGNWTKLIGSPIDITSLSRNDTILFAGTDANGVYISRDNGLSWTITNNGIPQNTKINSVLSIANKVIFGTENSGLLLATSSNLFWAPSNTGLFRNTISSLVTMGSNLFVGTQDGNYISKNAGGSWSIPNTNLDDIQGLAVSGNKLYAVDWDDAYVSLDSGISWSGLNLPSSGSYPSVAAFGNRIVIGYNAGGVYLSLNSGSSFTNISLGLSDLNDIYTLAIDDSAIIVGTLQNKIFRTIDNGTTWTPCYSSINGSGVFAEIFAFKDSVLFMGTPGNLYKSTNYGLNWTALGTNVPGFTYITSLTFSGANIFAKSSVSSNIYTSTDNGVSWALTNTGLPINRNIKVLGADSNYVYASRTNDGTWKRSIPEILCSLNELKITSPDSISICSGSTLNIPITSTSKAIYSWSGSNNPNILGGDTLVHSNDTINYTLVNSTSNPQTIVYTITPTFLNVVCPLIAPKKINVRINPSPIVSFSGLPDTSCNNGTTLSLVGNPVGINGIFSGNGISGNVYDPNVSGQGAHSITYTYTNTYACSSAVSQNTFVLSIPLPPEICQVSVDSLSKYNIITWEKPLNSAIDSFRIYREDVSNIYTHIASVGANEFSQYVDTDLFNANPNINTKRYKIAVKDTCGIVSSLSPYHNTVFTIDVGNGVFFWSLYEREGQPNAVLTYSIDKLDPVTHAVVQANVAYTSGTQNFLVVPNQDTAYDYRVRGNLNYSCNPTQRTQTGISVTRSNIKNRNAIGIKEFKLDRFIRLQPNPAHDFFFVKSELPIETITIIDVFGRIVSKQTSDQAKSGSTTHNISQLAAGIYTVNCKGKDFEVRKKLVVE